MIINLLLCVLSSFITLYTTYLFVIFIFGLFIKNKEYDYAKEENVAILIPCNNEETVISRLIGSIKKQNYKKYKVFVIAHNCTDNTANIARRHNVTVIDYNDTNAKTKADALNVGIKYVNDNYKDYFKYFVFFDADSVLDNNFLLEINNAMATNADVASGYLRSTNYNVNIISKLCSMLYLMTMNCNSSPNNYFKLPVNIYGSGFCVKSDLLKNGFNTSTLVEDFEFVTREVLNGKKFIFAEKAKFKIEMPIDLKSALKQRRRWAFGDTQCFIKYFFEYLKSLKKLGICGLKQLIDLCLNPFLLMGCFGIVLCLIKALTNKGELILFNILIGEGLIFLLVYILASISTMKKEGIVIKDNIDVILMMPFWFSLTIIYAVESFFVTERNFDKTEHFGVEDEQNI